LPVETAFRYGKQKGKEMRKRLRSFVTVLFISIAIMLLSFIGAMSMPGLHMTRAVGIGSWQRVNNMHYARQGDTATVLTDGRVLVVGGADDTGAVLAFAEIYSPKTKAWSITGQMHTPRMNQVAVLLPGGKVLVAGGSNGSQALSSAELYNPETGKWSLTGNMHVARENFSATLLRNGEVLVAGGDDAHQPFVKALSSAELYNPVTGKWKLTSSMHTARFHQIATLLPNGNVLVAGGDDGAGYASSTSACLCPHATASTELYNPSKGIWSKTGNMNRARDLFTSVVIPDSNGKVFVAGGFTCNTTTGSCIVMSSAEIYANGKWTLIAYMHTARYNFIAASLGASQILVAGGLTSARIDTNTAEIYNTVTGTWSSAASMKIPCDQSTASDLANGQLLTTGGVNSTGALSSAEVYARW
jgi:N-acetylneuraminic acid mutarotase